jgi:hypothetical protein
LFFVLTLEEIYIIHPFRRVPKYSHTNSPRHHVIPVP